MSIALEPEAASMYTQLSQKDRTVKADGTKHILSVPGIQYMVIDLGGMRTMFYFDTISFSISVRFEHSTYTKRNDPIVNIHENLDLLLEPANKMDSTYLLIFFMHMLFLSVFSFETYELGYYLFLLG